MTGPVAFEPDFVWFLSEKAVGAGFGRRVYRFDARGEEEPGETASSRTRGTGNPRVSTSGDEKTRAVDKTRSGNRGAGSGREEGETAAGSNERRRRNPRGGGPTSETRNREQVQREAAREPRAGGPTRGDKKPREVDRGDEKSASRVQREETRIASQVQRRRRENRERGPDEETRNRERGPTRRRRGYDERRPEHREQVDKRRRGGTYRGNCGVPQNFQVLTLGEHYFRAIL